MELTLTSEIEAVIKEQAMQKGMTPEQLALDALRKLFVPGVKQTDTQPASLADLLTGFIGVLHSSEHVNGGARMSEETGKQFAKMMMQKRAQGRL